MKTRIIWEKLQKEIITDEIIVITGPRQVGKTTTIHWLLDQIESDNKIYFDLQNIADKELFETKDFNDLVKEFENRGLDTASKVFVAIDEIQLLETLPTIVKYLHDHHNIKFFLTGSSSFYIKNKFSESMAGRKVIYEMFPLRFQEFIDFKGVNYKLPSQLELDAQFNNHAYNLLSTLYREYIEYGGLPKIVLTDDIDRKKQLLKEVFSSYITLDVEVLADFKSSLNLRRIIKLLASRIGSRININELSSVTGISRPTIDSYIEFLEKTYLIKNLDVYSNSPSVQIRKAGKIYFVDTGIANLNADLSSGGKYENTLCHQLSFYGNLNYYSGREGEIDFIVDKTISIEAKETPTHTDLTKLNTRSANIGIKNTRLIGKEQSAKFNDYLWGGYIR